MKAFIAALSVLIVTLGVTVVNDIYCHRVCQSIERSVENGGAAGAEEALRELKNNEFLLKLSVDNGYVSEARVSLESLVAAYECNDEYETTRYIRDSALRVERVRRALII